MKKYNILADEFTITSSGKKLFRIQALKDIPRPDSADLLVLRGEKGGYVESEANLSHTESCWVYHNAKVYDNALVSGCAMVRNNASVRGKAAVHGSSVIQDNASVYGNAFINANSEISGNSVVKGNAEIIGEGCKVWSNAQIRNTMVTGTFVFGDDAYVTSNDSFLGISRFGNMKTQATFYKTRYNEIKVNYRWDVYFFWDFVFEVMRGIDEDEWLKTFKLFKTIYETLNY